MVLKEKNKAVKNFAHELEIEGRSLWQDAFNRFSKNKAAMCSAGILSFILLLVFLGPLFISHSYDETNWDAINLAPSFSSGYLFGTDSFGRDLFVRTLVGGRVSFVVGIVGALVAIFLGTLYGATSGFIGGKVDQVMMRFLEILYSLPFMFFVILLVTFFGRNIFLIFLAIGAVSWLDTARIVRGQTLSIRKKEFIDAAYVCGVSSRQVIFRHIIPNVLGLVVIYATLLVPTMILFESFLSFLGLGVQEPMTSWGALLNEGSKIMEVAPWMLLFPASFMVITLFSFNYLGDGLRDALDPKDR
jgi:oligopeptide transport system permease protein